MSLMDYNSFGLIPVTNTGEIAVIVDGTGSDKVVQIETDQSAEYIRTNVNAGDKFVIVCARGLASADEPPYICTNDNNVVKYYAVGDRCTNYELEVTHAMLGGETGYVYFNNKHDIVENNKLIVYKKTGSNSLLRQIVQHEMIMLIKKQMEEM